MSNDRFLYRPVLDFCITLEARNPARHCLRQYRVEAGTYLFGVWVVEISYGRIDTAGRCRSYIVRDEKEALAGPQAGRGREAGQAGRTAVWQDEFEIHTNPKIGQMWMLRGQQAEVETPGTNEKARE